MKVAVCISGEYRNNVNLCRDSIEKYLPYKTFTHTWDATPQPDLPSMETFLQAFKTWIETLPENNASRIWFTKKLNYGRKYHHRIFQIYNHWHCMQYVPAQYDMIIRVRPDVVLFEHNWQNDIINSYNKDIVYGYGSGQGVEQNLVDRFASDHVIMHKRNRMRNPYKTLLPSSGHVAWWVSLHKSENEKFINNNEVCTLERNL